MAVEAGSPIIDLALPLRGKSIDAPTCTEDCCPGAASLYGARSQPQKLRCQVQSIIALHVQAVKMEVPFVEQKTGHFAHV